MSHDSMVRFEATELRMIYDQATRGSGSNANKQGPELSHPRVRTIVAGFVNTRSRRLALTSIIVIVLSASLLLYQVRKVTLLATASANTKIILRHPIHDTETPDQPNYLDGSEWNPLLIQDPFPSLATSPPRPASDPSMGRREKELTQEIRLSYRPPRLLLLQAVVEYITAG